MGKRTLLFVLLGVASFLIGSNLVKQTGTLQATPVVPSYLELLHMQNSISKKEEVRRVDTVNITVDINTQEVAIQSGTADHVFINVNTTGEIPVVKEVVTRVDTLSVSEGFPYIKVMGDASELKPIKSW